MIRLKMICFRIVHGAGHMARARGPGPGEEMFHASRDDAPPGGVTFAH
jgi:hypothetical protein